MSDACVSDISSESDLQMFKWTDKLNIIVCLYMFIVA